MLQQPCLLNNEIGWPATVWIDEDRRNPLRQQRSRVAQLRRCQPGPVMRVHVDETGSEE